MVVQAVVHAYLTSRKVNSLFVLVILGVSTLLQSFSVSGHLNEAIMSNSSEGGR